MAEHLPHHVVSLQDHLFQTLKPLFAAGIIRRFSHFRIRGGFKRLRFRMLEIENVTVSTKLEFISAG